MTFILKNVDNTGQYTLHLLLTLIPLKFVFSLMQSPRPMKPN